MSDDQLLQIQELIDSASASLKTANALLRDMTGVTDVSHERLATMASSVGAGAAVDGKVVEGVFDGQNMVDSDGQT